MAKLIETNPDNLATREERAQAKLARIARCDCVNGGARALTIADRLHAMGSRVDYDSVVSEAYTNSAGRAASYLAFECPECGSACMGEESARDCCAYDPESEEFAEESDD